MTPAVFTNAPFVELAARAEREDTLLLVDFTAGWCAPCQAMDATTWTDPLIEDWIRRNALAVQVDVDVDQATARHFAVSTMPTLVLLRGGCVLDRISGARPTAALISWLEATANGTSALDVQRAQLDPRDVQSRFAFARALLEAGRLDEASSHLEFLWLEGARLEPSWSGVRASYLVLVIAQLVDASPRARRRFEALRDAAQPRADDAETTRDWLALNEALNEGDRTLAWFEALRGQPPEWLRAEPRLRELLTSRERWTDVAALTPAPLEVLAREHAVIDQLRAAGPMGPQLEEALDVLVYRLRDTAHVLVQALRAAGRHHELPALQRYARELDGSVEMRDATA